MLGFWNKISEIGADREAKSISEKDLILTNRIVLFIFITLFLLFFYNFVLDGWTPFSRSLFFGNIGAIITIYSLNHFGFYNASRIVLSWMCSIYPFMTSLNSKLADVAGVEEAMYYMPRLYIIITSVIPILVFSYREWPYLALSLAGGFVPLLFFDFIHEQFAVGYHQLGFSGSIYHVFNAIALTAYSVFIAASLFFKRINEQHESNNLKLIHSLEKKNAELLEKNTQIESQAKDLETANYEIKVVNENLEQVVDKRTKELLDQSIQFQLFSYKNSHELRAPLANVLGVLDLLKGAESHQEIKQLVDLLNKSCKDLDRIVHEINHLLNKAVYKEEG